MEMKDKICVEGESNSLIAAIESSPTQKKERKKEITVLLQ
jgi:hypothetical protein